MVERTGWPLTLVAAAVTTNFLSGVLVVVNLPRLHARAGLLGALLWRNRAFLDLASGMALGLFAQIGLLAHLYSLLVAHWVRSGPAW